LFFIWVSHFAGIVDCLALSDSDARKVSKRIVLSKDFPGSDRDVHSRFMDAMALVAWYGRPDFFVTMACNPYWPEITDQLLPGQTPQDRPDVVARVYNAKLRDLHDFMIVKGHFGKLQPGHMLLSFRNGDCPMNTLY
jgi:hypothetical protein